MASWLATVLLSERGAIVVETLAFFLVALRVFQCDFSLALLLIADGGGALWTCGKVAAPRLDCQTPFAGDFST